MSISPGRPTAVYCVSEEQFARRVGRAAAEFGTLYRGPGFYESADGMKHGDNNKYGEICRPSYIGDVAEYHDDYTGSLISSRSYKREMMKRAGDEHETVYADWEPIVESRKAIPRDGYVCQEMCEATGLPYSEGAAEWLVNKKAELLAPPPVETRNLKFADSLDHLYE